MTAKPSPTTWTSDALRVVCYTLLWIVLVVKLYKGFAHMPLDQRFLYGLFVWLFFAAICYQTPKVIAKRKARAA